MATNTDLTVTCRRCGNEGHGYNDGENFERIYYDTLAPDTKCLECKRYF